MLLFHIIVGSICILSGAAALSFKKGSRNHRMAGLLFVASMVAMTVSGTILAYLRPAFIAMIAGVLTLYLVMTAFAVTRSKPNHTNGFDYIALVLICCVCLGAFYLGNQVAQSETGFIQGIEIPAGAYYFFAWVSAVCAVSDLRYVIRGGLAGAQRIARHLWRMGFAMYMATSSLFTGQPQRFPEALQNSGVLSVPESLVVLLVLFWFLKTLFWGKTKRFISRYREYLPRGA